MSKKKTERHVKLMKMLYTVDESDKNGKSIRENWDLFHAHDEAWTAQCVQALEQMLPEARPYFLRNIESQHAKIKRFNDAVTN